MHTDLQTQQRTSYEAPRLEFIELSEPLSLLASLSADALFEDFEAGEDLDTI